MHREPARSTISASLPRLILLACAAGFLLTDATPAAAQFFGFGKGKAYRPSQACPPIPKYEYTDAGQAILVKRFANYPTQDVCQFTRYRFVENTKGVEDLERCRLGIWGAGEVLSEQQKAIIAAWGEPDYLRGPYKSTRGDVVVEWAYHPLNRLFQFVDQTMVYQGPLTDQERTAITFGAPREVLISQLAPNIRRETWIYRPYSYIPYSVSREKLFSFSNGKLVFSQETP